MGWSVTRGVRISDDSLVVPYKLFMKGVISFIINKISKKKKTKIRFSYQVILLV